MPGADSTQPHDHQLPLALLQSKLEHAIALHQQGNLAQAERIYREILRHRPDHSDALHLLGVVALQSGRPDRAADLIGKAIGLNAGVAAVHNNLGKALLDLKRPADALASFEQAIALEPRFAMAHNNRATALIELMRFEQALASCDQALALEPGLAIAHNNRGMALNELMRPKEALDSCEQAIAIDPNFAEAYINRGNALLGLRRPAVALTSYDQALALNRDSPLANKNRAMALEKLHRYDEAVNAFDVAYRLDPELIGLEADRFHAKMRICHWAEFDNGLTHLRSLAKSGRLNTAPFPLLAIPLSLDDLFRCATLWIAGKHPPSETPIYQGPSYHHERIRIGYLSPDFREHPISFLTAGMFECHDRSRFEITALACSPGDKSDTLRRLKASIEHFVDVASYGDDQIANLVKEMEIDILVDLAGLTAGARTNVFARRPAPLQVNFLGYPGTIGASYIDYIIADRIVIPENHYKFYAEKIVTLPDSYLVTDSKAPVGRRTFARHEFGLPDSGFVFCCFNNSYKITPPIFDCWMRILGEVEDSVLWLFESNAWAAENLRREAAARGVRAERLIFAKRTPLLSDHFARYRLAGLFLDTLFYNAHTTASDALWAGVPVLTCLGETFSGRAAASLLTAVGLPELVTTTLEAYARTAIDLATHPEKLATIKSKLADNRLTTPLFDTGLFTKNIEAAYSAMYQRHQAGLPPDHIAIPKPSVQEP